MGPILGKNIFQGQLYWQEPGKSPKQHKSDQKASSTLPTFDKSMSPMVHGNSVRFYN